MLHLIKSLNSLGLLALCVSALWGNASDEYQPQTFFDRNDLNTFLESETGELLQKIMVGNEVHYLQQDGDLYEEDVATIDALPVMVKGAGDYSFARSKQLLARSVYEDYHKAFYSDCDYIIDEKKLIPVHKTCGYHYRKNKNRANRIEWEHIVPAWHFGHQLQCWQKGGRMTCRQTNTKFRQMEADMHNLVPAIGEINGDRSNYKYGMIEGEARLYGEVDIEIHFKERRAEPQESRYGEIARTYLYMRDRYGLQISATQEKLLIAWNNLDPVSAWEKKRNQRIKELQGDENMYVTEYRRLDQPGTSSDKPILFDDIWDALSAEYADALAGYSAPIAGVILLGMTLVVMYRRRQEQRLHDTEVKLMTGYCLIVTKLTDSAISINDNDEVVIQKVDRNNPNQRWVFTKANKKKEYFFIENVARQKVIMIKNSDTNDGASIILGDKRRQKNDHQEWKFVSADDQGYVFIESKWSLNVLDVKYKKIKDGTRLQSFHKKVRGTENQEWHIKRY
ncbi:MAG TPA: hypothetical protein ENK86_03380 [Campylobacterales bacterium]|nr:hypothetical protein [Campylobacterales bacterium]